MLATVIDVETTGLYPRGHDRIVELAILQLGHDQTIASEFHSLLNPRRDIGPTWLHGIETRDVLDAPEFLDIAGEVTKRLDGAVIVGHNVGFDLRFLESEFSRGNIPVPRAPYLDTLRLAIQMGTPSRRLEDACELFGIALPHAHSALDDARATAALFASIVERLGPREVENQVVCPTGSTTSWPSLEVHRPPYPREKRVRRARSADGFMAALVRQLPVSTDDTGSWQSYYSLLDRVLEDRRISSAEASLLRQCAVDAGLTASDVQAANEAYLQALIDIALKDDFLSESEEHDLQEVAELLGLGSALQQMLGASREPTHVPHETAPAGEAPVQGRRVCFTGAMNASIGGQRVSREMAEQLASERGMIVSKSVTKKLDYLVIADPDSLSGKARKARQYGTRILAESVFWNLLGVNTDG